MDRETLIQAITGLVTADPRIEVAWLGGADATGRVDARSDLDLMLAVESEDREVVIEAFEEAFDRVVGIRHRHRFVEPHWSGFDQAIYLGRGLSDDLAIDLTIVPTDTPLERRLLEVDRHGEAVVLVDRRGWFDRPTRSDVDRQVAGIDRRLARIRGLHPFFVSIVRKGIDRGRDLEALDGYRAKLLAPLCDLMRIEHDPARFDFAFRYLDRDLPADERALLERLAFVPDASGLPRRVDRCQAEIERRLERLTAARRAAVQEAVASAKPSGRR
ncbi:MAG: hypothetical protein CMJ54_05485 [Planctomycetaceae bacterium]|nr:hypothetical protein [Planctomycetaceae bacterium]